MKTDTTLLLSQVAVLVVLGTLVGLGHNSGITDALLATSGSLVGTGIYAKVKGSSEISPTK